MEVFCFNLHALCSVRKGKVMSESDIDAVKKGDKSAFENVLKSFEPLILSEASKMVAKNPEFAGEEEEFRQEGRLALYDAAVKYEENGAVTFGLYAKICIHNRLISYLRKLVSRRRKAERVATRELDEARDNGAEELIVALESNGRLRKFIDENTTPYERRVFTLYVQRLTYAEIAKQLGKDEKSVDNAIYRVKAKIKKMFL